MFNYVLIGQDADGLFYESKMQRLAYLTAFSNQAYSNPYRYCIGGVYANYYEDTLRRVLADLHDPREPMQMTAYFCRLSRSGARSTHCSFRLCTK